MIPSFDRGDVVRLGNPTGTNDDGSVRAAFTTLAGVVTDPTTVTLEILRPATTVPLVYNWPVQGTGDGVLTRETLARFYFDVVLDVDGNWQWKLFSTGAVQTSESGTFHVRWSPFA